MAKVLGQNLILGQRIDPVATKKIKLLNTFVIEIIGESVGKNCSFVFVSESLKD